MMGRRALEGAVLRVPRKLLDEIYARGRAHPGEEVCGILAGHQKGGERLVERVYHMRNVHERHTHEYAFDPQEQLRVILEAEDEHGLDIVGFYHSHPRGPAHLSKTDVARASWPGASYFLLYLGDEEGHTSARWNAEARAFEYEDVEIA